MSTTTESVIPVGMHKGIPAPEYHRRELGVVSNSALKLVRRSPAHYKAWIDGLAEDRDSPALAFGRAFHCALLEPEVFSGSFVVQPEFGDQRKPDNKKAKLEWLAANGHAEAIEPDDMLAIQGMVASVRRHPLASKMIHDGEAELTLSWRDEYTGLPCKSRLDYYVRELAMIADVKTCEDGSSEKFRRDVAKFSYHRQDALYRAAAMALELPVQHFVLLAVEKSPPYAVATYTLDADGIGRGYQDARRDIDVLAECMRTGRFPAYPETILELEVPPWA